MSGNEVVSLAWCKELLTLDDRDDCITTGLIECASTRVEHYLMRRVRERTFTEYHDSLARKEIGLAEYPVREVRTVHCDPARRFGDETLIGADAWFCATVPYDVLEDLPAVLIFDSFLSLPVGSRIIQVIYRAGYPLESMPEDLKLAAAELVAWNFKRIKSKQVGVTGLSARGGAAEPTALEIAMPANVREMLEPYRRRTW